MSTCNITLCTNHVSMGVTPIQSQLLDFICVELEELMGASYVVSLSYPQAQTLATLLSDAIAKYEAESGVRVRPVDMALEAA